MLVDISRFVVVVTVVASSNSIERKDSSDTSGSSISCYCRDNSKILHLTCVICHFIY